MKKELEFHKIKKRSDIFLSAMADLLEAHGISGLHPKDQVFVHLKIGVSSLSFAHMMLLMGSENREEGAEMVRNLKKETDEEIERIINRKLEEYDREKDDE